jgi:hypothetical protein
MRAALDPPMRTAILAIKRELKYDPVYSQAGIHSRHVYLAALEGVRDLAAFRAWVDSKGLL